MENLYAKSLRIDIKYTTDAFLELLSFLELLGYPRRDDFLKQLEGLSDLEARKALEYFNLTGKSPYFTSQ